LQNCMRRRRTWKQIPQTSFLPEPLVFLPCFSNSRRYSRSSANHWRATLYKDEGGAYVSAAAAAVSVGTNKGEAKGQAVGSVTNSPKRMWAMQVGKVSRPSKMWVASEGFNV